MNSTGKSQDCMWTPSAERAAATHVELFRHRINDNRGGALADFNALHEWSVSSPQTFWTELWDYANIIAEQRGSSVLENASAMPGARWFPDARLNFAQNLLAADSLQDDSQEAIIFKGEVGELRHMSRQRLYAEVRAVAAGLRKAGVGVGDRVAGFMPNIPETVVAMLATSSLGAVWSSCSPDFGINGVQDRFGQIEPKVLFTADGYRYGGKTHDSLAVAGELARSLPSLCALVVVSFIESDQKLDDVAGNLTVSYTEWIEADQAAIAEGAAAEIEFVQLPFDHPLYIMFSSGTTGKPKCIVHGAGGTLLQHVKEHLLHADIQPGDKLFFFTTCGWMMWNWLVSALASKATILLYDCLLYTSPSPRDRQKSRMPSSA